MSELKDTVIIVDVMGGDLAPEETVKGLCLASKENKSISFTVVGDRPAIERIITENGCNPSDFNIVHSETVINMDDDPMAVVRAKSGSSMNIGLTLLSESKGDAFVSTGNTGALFTGATLIVHKIKGVQRAAIATLLPMKPPVLLVDSGANVVVNEESIEQFAIMGSAYMKKLYGIEAPRVGLLNNGTESAKGTPLMVECHKRLSELPGIKFVGNVEAGDVPFNACDVLVTDGFTGNVFLKSIEGTGKLVMKELKEILYANVFTKLAALIIKKPLYEFKHNYDSAELGGAPLIGIAAPVIKAHGSSDAKAFKGAIDQAIRLAQNDTTDVISAEMEKYTEYRRARRKAEKAQIKSECLGDGASDGAL